MPARTMHDPFPFIRYVERHETLPSTNDRALELARNPTIPLPALIVAQQQTAGRGCGTKAWWSEQGALTFSVVLDAMRPLGKWKLGKWTWPLAQNTLSKLSLATAVAVSDVLAELAPSVPWGIKWPNDVVVDDGPKLLKIAGILIEMPASIPSGRHRIVVGIGININNSLANAPKDVQQRGISLCDIGISHCHPDHLPCKLVDSPLIERRNYPLDDVLQRCLIALERYVSLLIENDDRLVKAWQTRCLLSGRSILVEHGNQRHAGRCLAIDHDGALLLDMDGQIVRFLSGSVIV
ncbi:MAG: biotin--[acetyl-CoA-carboxylase] ligase [Pirellulales bacterium]|nr:biotin--[acetyl-CoA-carboxylase] ligase [Pirellulales bacterium]